MLPDTGQAKESGFRNGLGSESYFSLINDLTQTSPTDILAADTMNHCIRKLDRLTGHVGTFAGQCRSPGDIDSQTNSTQSRLQYPVRVIVNESNRVVYYLQYTPAKIVAHNLSSGKGISLLMVPPYCCRIASELPALVDLLHVVFSSSSAVRSSGIVLDSKEQYFYMIHDSALSKIHVSSGEAELISGRVQTSFVVGPTLAIDGSLREEARFGSEN